MNALLAEIKDWAHKPYREDGNLLDWFLFIGLWIVAAYLWARVIRRLAD
jgi:hypothetical protein